MQVTSCGLSLLYLYIHEHVCLCAQTYEQIHIKRGPEFEGGRHTWVGWDKENGENDVIIF